MMLTWMQSMLRVEINGNCAFLWNQMLHNLKSWIGSQVYEIHPIANPFYFLISLSVCIVEEVIFLATSSWFLCVGFLHNAKTIILVMEIKLISSVWVTCKAMLYALCDIAFLMIAGFLNVCQPNLTILTVSSTKDCLNPTTRILEGTHRLKRAYRV